MDLSLLLPGDCLLYRPVGFFGWLISIKTWHPYAHVEIYIGDGFAAASRDGLGVDSYTVRETELIGVYRPDASFHLPAALAWFLTSAKGQGYDWLGLLRFTWRTDYSRGDKNNKQFCSEFATRFYRAGGFDPFPSEDADAVPPFYFAISPLFKKIWSKQ